jgi:hypothetical protein
VTRFPIVATILLLGLGGCISRHGAPITWEQAVRPGAQATDAVAGLYADSGEMEVAGGSGRGSRLHLHFFDQERLPGWPNRVRLSPQDDHTLKVEALRDDQVLATKVVEYRIQPGDGRARGASLQVKADSRGGSGNLGVGWSASSIHLYRGADGRLYGEKRESGGGLFGYFLPVYTLDYRWGRWDRVD